MESGTYCNMLLPLTSQPIRLTTNFMTFIPSLTFTELWVVSMEHLQRVVASQQGTLTLPDTWFRPPFLGLAFAPIVETRFLELAMSLLDFSPWIPLGTFSILLLFHLVSDILKKIPGLTWFVWQLLMINIHIWYVYLIPIRQRFMHAVIISNYMYIHK